MKGEVSEMSRLRLIVFTAGPLSPIDRVFYERLAGDPLLDLRAIVVDDSARRRRPLHERVAHGVRRDGWAWLWFKAVTTTGSLARRATLALFGRLHPAACEESYRTLERETGVPVHHVADIHSEESLALVRSFEPQLGVAVGEGILREALISVPERGALSIDQFNALRDRDGGPIGEGELLTGASSISVTMHATSPSAPGGVMAEGTIPLEECDTLESVRIKLDLVGAQLYHDAIRAVARGERPTAPQDPHAARPTEAPSEFRLWQLERRLRRRAVQRTPVLRERPSVLVRARVLIQYVLVSPVLFWRRWRLQRQGRAPVCVLYYHLVANRPLNHMCLPLEDFVRQMEFLRRYYPLLSLEQAAARLGRDDSDEVAVAITFDDGYRDNTWAIEYLRYFGIPACFFVSIGHVLDGSPFDHDRRRGFAVQPLSEADLRGLAADGFELGSHGIYHENFGELDAESAERVLSESQRLIGQVTGSLPEHFSFPKGQRGANITAEAFTAAIRHYRHVYSAYGGYNIPGRQTRHLLRLGNPIDVIELAMILDGYTGLRQCLMGNAWGLKTSALAPYVARSESGMRAATRWGRLLSRGGR
jgi:peptidoglycan/xylan/chitin deacetylase (PgdA/CDA1 family)